MKIDPSYKKDIISNYINNYLGNNPDILDTSPFLKKLYSSDKIFYNKYKETTNDILLNMKAHVKVPCSLPVSFRKVMLLSEKEEVLFRNAVLDVAKKLGNQQYLICVNDTRMQRFEMPSATLPPGQIYPFITIHIMIPEDDKPHKGFFFKGIFTRDTIYKEIEKITITAIVYDDNNGNERTLLTFS